jgi:hypothetical protein
MTVMQSGMIAVVTLTGALWVAAPATQMEVYKSRTCGCCAKWVSIVQTHSFEVRVNDLDSVEPIKNRYKIPARLRSCHTAIADGYVFEGHVPPDLIARVLREKPSILGLAVAGMPVGSPGMEVPSGRTVPYDVIAIGRDGKLTIFARR